MLKAFYVLLAQYSLIPNEHYTPMDLGGQNEILVEIKNKVWVWQDKIDESIDQNTPSTENSNILLFVFSGLAFIFRKPILRFLKKVLRL